MDSLPILQSFTSLLSVYKGNLSRKFDVRIENAEQARLATIRTFSKRYVDDLIKKKTLALCFKQFIRSDSIISALDSGDSDYIDDDWENELPKEETVLKYFIKSSSTIKDIPNINKENDIKYDFKGYIEKQMTHQNGDCINIFDHLKTNIKGSQVNKHILSSIQMFSVKLNKIATLKTDERVGLGIVIDPTFRSKEAISMIITYSSSTEPIEIPLQAAESIPDEYNLTLNPQSISTHHTHHIPGWDGVMPIFVPSTEFKCQLLTTEDQEPISCPISMLVFPASSIHEILSLLRNAMEEYHMKAITNHKVMGGMPLCNLAALQGEYRIVASILSKGGNPNFRSPVTMNTSLHEAVCGHNVKILSLLLSHGAGQMLSDYQGNTPLHLACSLGYVDMVRILLNDDKGNMSVFAENDAGKKPIDLCKTTYLKVALKEKMTSLQKKVVKHTPQTKKRINTATTFLR